MYPIAKWPPQTNTRQYFLADGKEIQPNTTGSSLPAHQLVAVMEKQDTEFHQQLLSNTRLYTNLPAKFFETFLQIQRSENPIPLPGMRENKNITVRQAFARNKAAFADATGPLHPDRWKLLGWVSKQAYNHWLDTSMLFAFSHCMHYCLAPRVFDGNIEANEKQSSPYKFKQTLTDINSIADAKTTAILSVTGFDYRNFSGKIKATLKGVYMHSYITINQILKVAAATKTTDIVLIPYGTDVFLPPGEDGNEIRNAIFQCMTNTLIRYSGPPITIHCCGDEDFYDSLEGFLSQNITLVNQSGKDAYSLANAIQDSDPQIKTMLINAGDNDWTALLNPRKQPGQQSAYHCLYHQTSDEYYALMTCFSYFSLQRLMAVYGPQFLEKISSDSGRPSNQPQQSNLQFKANGNIPPFDFENIKQFLQTVYDQDDPDAHQDKTFQITKIFNSDTEQYNYMVSLSEDEGDKDLLGDLVRRMHQYSIKNKANKPLEVARHRIVMTDATFQNPTGFGIIITPNHLHEMANVNFGCILIPPKLNVELFKKQFQIDKVEFLADGIRFCPKLNVKNDANFLAGFLFRDLMDRDPESGAVSIKYDAVRNLDIPGINQLAQVDYKELFLSLCIEAMMTGQNLVDVIAADKLYPRNPLEFNPSLVKSFFSWFEPPPKMPRPPSDAPSASVLKPGN